MSHRVLLVGLGQVGMGYDFDLAASEMVLSHANAFVGHPDFKVVGGVDPDPKACARFLRRYGIKASGDLVESIITLKPEIIVIASPTQCHAECVRLALHNAKPRLILCEKPLASTLEDAEDIVAACRAAGCKLYVNYMRRVEPGVQEVKRRLMDGRIALPLKGTLWYSKGLLHNGSHFSNLLEFWLGPVESFKIINSGHFLNNQDIQPDVHVKFEAGEISFLAAHEGHFSHHEIQLVAPNGCLRYEQGGATIRWQSVTKDPQFPRYNVLSILGEKIPTESYKLQLHVANNVSACLSEHHSYLCSGDDALETLKALMKIKVKL